MPKPAEPEVRSFEHVVRHQPDFRVWVAELRACGWALLEREAQVSRRGNANYLFIATRERPEWPPLMRYRCVVRARVFDARWHFRLEGEDGWTGRGVGDNGTDDGILIPAGRILRRERGMRSGEFELTLHRE